MISPPIRRLRARIANRLVTTLLLAGLAFSALSLARPGLGHAEMGPFWRNQGEKPGPWMFNLKMGGAFSLFYGDGYHYLSYPHFFLLEAEAGLALDKNRAAYLIFSPQFALRGDMSMIMLPFGFQYDIPLPLPGLYLTPRASAGFGAVIYNGFYYAGYNTSEFVGFVTPEFGAKYVLKGRLNFGAELFSLPIIFGSNGVAVHYRALIYGGINL